MSKPPLLTLSGIGLTFGGAPLFTDMALAVQAGERACLVGRNGSGKSTLLRIMAGEVEPDQGERLVTPGVQVAYLAQEPDFTAYETLAAFATADLEPGDEHRALRVLEGLGVDPDTLPAAASGGEQRRAALARLLSAEAEIMLLDEPTNHLDIEAIGWLEETLAAWRGAYVLISHDRAFLRRLSQSTFWVDRGVVRRLGRGFDGFEAWRDKTYEEEQDAAHKLNRLIKAEARWAVEGISARRKRNMGRVRRLAELRDTRARRIAQPGVAELAFDAGPTSGRLVIEARGISKHFGSRVIVDDWSLRVQRGERIALVGPNGAGKTTILRMLIGQEAPDEGTVRLGSGLQMVVFDQTREALDPTQSLWDALISDPEAGVSGRSDQVMVRGQPRHVVGYLKDFMFEERQARGPVSALSGGEAARLLLARLMARESNLLVLDEPTNDLDVETLDLLQELVADYSGTVLLISHDRDFIDRVATTTIHVEGDGALTVYAGGWTDMLAQQRDRPPNAISSAKATPKRPPRAQKPDSVRKLTFNQVHRLEVLPDEIARLEAEIARIETFLADPDLFANAPGKFSKATEGLAERQAALSAAEDEWLTLETLREALGGQDT